MLPISDDLYKEITLWLSIRNMGDPYHRNRTLAPNDLIFPTEAGTPYRIGNYLKRIMKPIAAKAGIHDMTYRALVERLRRNFNATVLLKTPRLNCALQTGDDGWYMREIPESVRAAVAEMDAQISQTTESNRGDAHDGRPQ